MTEFVKLADQSVPVVPQPHARLRHYLTGEDFQQIMGGDYATNAYRILGVLIPELPNAIPEYRWEGFASQEDLDRYRAGDRDAYDDDAVRSAPDFDQITLAFETAVKVNGGERLGKLLGLIKTVQGMTDRMTVQPTPPSPVMHGSNGA